MSVFKRGDTWWVSITVNGRRVRQSAGIGATKQQAQEIEAKIRGDIHAGRVGRAPERSCEDALLRWLKGEAKALKSYENLKDKAALLRPFIKGAPLREAPAAATRAKEAWLQEGLKAATINRRLAILRRLCNLAHKEWGWLDNPVAQRITLVKGEESRHVYLGADEIDRLAEAAGGAIGDAIRLAAMSGLRESELLGLKPAQIAGDCIVLGPRTKNGKPRRVPLPEGGGTLALRLIEADLTYAKLRTGFEAARTQTGMAHVRFHDLRHSYASLLLADGAPLIAVRDLMGHSNLSVTSRYAHLVDGHLEGVVVNLEKSQIGHKKK